MTYQDKGIMENLRFSFQIVDFGLRSETTLPNPSHKGRGYGNPQFYFYSFALFFASVTAPTSPTRRMTDAISTGTV